MVDVESLVKRIEAIRDFDEELIAYVRAFEARERHLSRAKQWMRWATPEQREELLNLLEALNNDKQVFRLDTAFRWMGKYPNLEAPSFSPSAIRKRFSSRSPNNIFNQFKLWTNNPEHPRPELTDPLLIQLADEIDDILWEFGVRDDT